MKAVATAASNSVILWAQSVIDIVTSFLLREDGFHILREDGSKFIRES